MKLPNAIRRACRPVNTRVDASAADSVRGSGRLVPADGASPIPTETRARSARARRFLGGSSGQALVPVLFIVAILTGLAVSISLTAKRELRAAGNQTQAAQASLIEHGAINYVMNELEQVTNGGCAPPALTPPPNTDANGWTQLGDGWYKVDCIDTTARLNINTEDVATIGKLPAFLNDPNIAPAIVDWRDTDETTTTVNQTGGVGAESDYYSSLNPPYNAKDAPFDTVDELLLVRGITPSMLYGAPGVNNYALTSQDFTNMMNASSMTSSTAVQAAGYTPAVDTSQSTIPTSELVTTYSREADVYSDGSGTARVNITTASASDMQTQLSITAAQANAIVNGRGTGGANLTSIADLFNPSVFPGFTRTTMQQIGDQITVGSSGYRTNVCNINTAAPEVVAALPNMSQTIFSAIMQARQSGTVFVGMNDIFQLTQLQASDLQAVVNDFCTKSLDYLIRVRVRFPGSTMVYAAEALVELAPPNSGTSTGSATSTSLNNSTTNTTGQLNQPQVVQYRELNKYPGWSSWTQPIPLQNPNISTTGGTIVSP